MLHWMQIRITVNLCSVDVLCGHMTMQEVQTSTSDKSGDQFTFQRGFIPLNMTSLNSQFATVITVKTRIYYLFALFLLCILLRETEKEREREGEREREREREKEAGRGKEIGIISSTTDETSELHTQIGNIWKLSLSPTSSKPRIHTRVICSTLPNTSYCLCIWYSFCTLSARAMKELHPLFSWALWAQFWERHHTGFLHRARRWCPAGTGPPVQ